MSTAMFLKLHGIHGESRSPRHLGAIEISGFTWGNDRRLSGSSSAVGPGNISITDVIVYKSSDRTSPVLRQASDQGRHIRHGVLTVEDFSNTGCLVRTSVWRMESIVIGSITNAGHDPYGGGITEAVTLNFANHKIERG